MGRRTKHRWVSLKNELRVRRRSPRICDLHQGRSRKESGRVAQELNKRLVRRRVACYSHDVEILNIRGWREVRSLTRCSSKDVLVLHLTLATRRVFSLLINDEIQHA